MDATATAPAADDFLASLLAHVGVAPTADDIAADALDRANARYSYCYDALGRTAATHGYGRTSDAAATHLHAARRNLVALGGTVPLNG